MSSQRTAARSSHASDGRTAHSNTNTGTFQQSSMYWECLGFLGISRCTTIRMRSSMRLSVYLIAHPAVLDLASTTPPIPIPTEAFVEPPALSSLDGQHNERLQRLVRKFDPAERDHRNRSLGMAGESFVVDLERRQLSEADQPDLARRVRWISVEDGDGAGYDVLSFDQRGNIRLIEVKTTNGAARTPFFLSRNELSLALDRPKEWQIYRVHLFASGPRVFTIKPPLDSSVNLAPENWRASF